MEYGQYQMIINQTDSTLDRTWNDIRFAVESGCICVVKIKNDSGVIVVPVIEVSISESGYLISTVNNFFYMSSTPDGVLEAQL